LVFCTKKNLATLLAKAIRFASAESANQRFAIG
jgi:hypothetical protein